MMMAVDRRREVELTTYLLNNEHVKCWPFLPHENRMDPFIALLFIMFANYDNDNDNISFLFNALPFGHNIRTFRDFLDLPNPFLFDLLL